MGSRSPPRRPEEAVLGSAGPQVRREEIAKSRRDVAERRRRFTRVGERMIEGEGEVGVGGGGGGGGVELARISDALGA